MEKKHIIVITNTDMTTSAGNVTLLLRRAESCYRIKNYITDFIVYHGRVKPNIEKVEDYYNIVNADNWNELKKLIVSLKPVHIILYGDRVKTITYPLRLFLKKNNIQSDILLDIQGAIEEKKEYAHSIKKKIRYPFLYCAFKYAISFCDGAFVVSNELMENCEEKKMTKRSLVYHKVRCGVNSLFTLEQISRNREEIRAQYGISDSTVVFSYSGYRMPWQKIDEIIEDFKKYDKLMNDTFFIFLCNTDAEFEEQLRKAFPKGNYYVALLGKDAYVKTMCACDIGYILRDYNITNKVAFPNKFSDYLSSGMLLAMNHALPEPLRIIDQHNIPYIDTDNKSIEANIKIIMDYKSNWRRYVEKALSVTQEELAYDSQIGRLKF